MPVATWPVASGHAPLPGYSLLPACTSSRQQQHSMKQVPGRGVACCDSRLARVASHSGLAPAAKHARTPTPRTGACFMGTSRQAS